MRRYAGVPIGAALAGVALAGALLDPAAVRPAVASPESLAPAASPAPVPPVTAPTPMTSPSPLASAPPPGPAAVPPAPSAKACTASLEVSIGAGVTALLTLGPAGPAVTFSDGPGNPVPGLGRLDRKHPALPASAGIRAEIRTPYGPAPRLRTKVEGGPQAPYQVQDFPRLPKDCGRPAAGH